MSSSQESHSYREYIRAEPWLTVDEGIPPPKFASFCEDEGIRQYTYFPSEAEWP